MEDADESGAQAAAVVVPEAGTADVVCVYMPHEAVVDVDEEVIVDADQANQGLVEVCASCTVVVVVADQSTQGPVEVCAGCTVVVVDADQSNQGSVDVFTGCTVVADDDAGHSPQL